MQQPELLAQEMFVPGWGLLVPYLSLPMLFGGAVMGVAVAAYAGVSRIFNTVAGGAVGGVIGGWLAFLLFRDARDANAVLGAMFIGAYVGSGILSVPVARLNKGTKPPSTGV